MKRLWLVLGLLLLVLAVSIAYAARLVFKGAPIANTTLASASVTPSSQSKPEVELTYIANEGVLISAGGKQVLLDGLHRNERAFSHYASLPPAEREKLETAQAPFDKIDLLLVSHRHYDHFHAEAVGRHLKQNPQTILVSSQQVTSDVEQQFKDYEAIKARVLSATPPLKERAALKVAGIELEVLGLGHGSGSFREIQNLGHIIKLGGKKFLHVGDVEPDAEIFAKFKLAEADIDFAILPFWLLTSQEGQAIVKEHIKPKHLIAVHLETLKAASITSQIKATFPAAVVFTTMLEKQRY